MNLLPKMVACLSYSPDLQTKMLISVSKLTVSNLLYVRDAKQG